MSTQQMISYRILLRKEPEGGYTITVDSSNPYISRE